MIEINLFDSNFPDQACSVALQTPVHMRYVRNQMHWPGITVFTDGHMFDPIVDDVQSRYKIGWLHEGRCLHPENYDGDRLMHVAHKFDAIMTHDAYLLKFGAMHTSAGPLAVKETRMLKTIRGGSWVAPDQWGTYLKTKHVSMILSDKTQLDGHKLRRAIARAGLPIDLYGPSYTPIGHDKALAYKDYRYAVVVEACREKNFFSEHLIDAIAFGCVPIYWGCPNIGDWFDPKGFFPFASVADLVTLMEMLDGRSVTAYRHIQGQLTRNQTAARDYAITEDWQIANCLRPFVEAL